MEANHFLLVAIPAAKIANIISQIGSRRGGSTSGGRLWEMNRSAKR